MHVFVSSLAREGKEKCWSSCCSFFFFQAEDGIRDIGVTGVQTCALPILGRRFPACPRRTCAAGPDRRASVRRTRRPPSKPRSEERRVGKEGRSRWSPYH